MQRKIKTSSPNRKKVKARAIAKKKKPSIAQLKAKLWRCFSEYIRIKDSNTSGNICCVTCGDEYYWKDPKGRMQCGHLFPKKGFPNLYYDEHNVAPQCSSCNGFLEGAQYAYSLYIIKRYGQKEMDRLYNESLKHRNWAKADKKNKFKWNKDWVEKKLIEYTEKLKKEKLKRNIK